MLLAAAGGGDPQARAARPVAWAVAWALRAGQHTADSADLIGGALRIRGRMAQNRIRRARWFTRTVRDPRWSDALAVVSVVAPLLLLVAALTEFGIPQALAGSVTGHPHWRPTATLSLADLPLAAGAPAVTLLAFLRLRRLAGARRAGHRDRPDRGRRRPGLRRVRQPGGRVHGPALLHRRRGAAALAGTRPRPGPADLGRHRAGRRRRADPRRVQRGRQRVVRHRVGRFHRLRRRGGRPARPTC